MFHKEVFRKIPSIYPRVNIRFSSQINIKQLEEDSGSIKDSDEDTKLKNEEIEQKRNKSGLKESDRNFLFERTPYSEPTHWTQGTLKYVRRTYGRYGEASGVNPSICWPTKEELKESLEYEKVAYPYKVSKMIEDAKIKRQEKNKAILLRQQEIAKRLEKLEGWKQDLHKRIAKKEAEATAAKERKERLMEEVRAHFGYTVDPKDEKFMQLLEKKEKEQKKAMKEARKKARQENMMNQLLSKKTNKEPEVEDSEKKDE